MQEVNTSSTRREKQPTSLSSMAPREGLFFFGPIALFTTFIRSEICNRMHFGLGEFRDNPRELWHSHPWRPSVRRLVGLLTMHMGSPYSPQASSPFVATTLVAPVAVLSLVQHPKSVSMLAVFTVLARTFDQVLLTRGQGVIAVEVQQVPLQPPLLSNEGLRKDASQIRAIRSFSFSDQTQG